MIDRPSLILDVVWIVWLISWIAASFWSGRVRSRIDTSKTWTYRACLIAGGVLLVPYVAIAIGDAPFWRLGFRATLALGGLLIAGLALTWSARLHLGALWSSAITRKEDHSLIDTGPYALVRHPIYCGLIIGLVATVAAEPTRTALLGAALAILGLYLKAQFEERFIAAELGAGDYDAYRRRVAMLIPFCQRSERLDRTSR